MDENQAVTIVEGKPFAMQALSPSVIKNQIQIIQHVMKAVMKDGVHYGKIPGCGDKKALLKPGSEILCVTFRLAPEFKIEKTDLDREHREYEITTRLVHSPTGELIGAGVGSCSTMESKYRYRTAKRVCPSCGQETIMKSKYGKGEWYCNEKRGGCKSKFDIDDKAITGQQLGRVENEDIADVYNTVLKMGKKRSMVDAVLTALAASDIFEQDIDEDHIFDAIGAEFEQPKGKKPKTEKPKEKTTKPPQAKQETNGKRQPNIALECPDGKGNISPDFCEEEKCLHIDGCGPYQGYLKSRKNK